MIAADQVAGAAPGAPAALAPLEQALAGVRQRRGSAGTAGLAPGLLVPAGTPGWTPAAELLTGGFLDDLLVAAKQRWNATPHVAAALAWRSYTYWLAMPVVLGWATAGRVLLPAPEDVLLRLGPAGDRLLLTIGLRRLRFAVRASDPLASTPDTRPGAAGPVATVVGSEQQLLGVLRSSLRDQHLDPLRERFQTQAKLGARTLLGSLASAVAYGAVRGMAAPPVEVIATAETLLSALDLADLVTVLPGPDGPTVQRRTCCLAFTLPEPKICSGCCLRTPPALPG